MTTSATTTPTSTPTAPNPAPGTFLSSVKSSCAAARSAAGLKPNVEAIDSFLLSLDRAKWDRLKLQHGLSFPLRFPSVVAEVNFLGVLALLNGLSGYRKEFHGATGCGVYQNVVRLLFGLYITGGEGQGSGELAIGSSNLTAKGLMHEITEAKVADLLGISLHKEEPHPSIPGLVVGTRTGPLLEATQLIVQTCSDTGARLVRAGYPHLAAFLIETLRTASASPTASDEEKVDTFLQALVEFLPSFADQHSITLFPASADGDGDGEQDPGTDASTSLNINIYIYKRAFFLLHSLVLLLKQKSDSTTQLIALPDTTATLPMFVDNVLPTMAVHFGFFCLSGLDSQSQSQSQLQLGGGLKEPLKGIVDWIRSSSTSPTKFTIEETMDREDQAAVTVKEAGAGAGAGSDGGIAPKLPKEGPTLSPDQAYLVRAATLDLASFVVARAHHLATLSNTNTNTNTDTKNVEWLAEVNQVDLDGYLWAVAKDDPELRKVPRFVQKRTIMF
ncbi:hypothetical protein BCV70DRAFT_202265 [Testicularia cyperi]|uniref:Queuosine 5'-phosphate N-glycosylase/hydrolase n=1 Tax=Testicularia cyperi TaxID=1882483 RepID=A0A317XLA6_9BASI|nr:hypothetical protein BCV70DRAFT_202265 [Testicularia cyperi]